MLEAKLLPWAARALSRSMVRPRRSRDGLLLAAALGLGAVAFSRRVLRQLRRLQLRERVVLITGGSRGLGLELARRFAAEGSRLVLLARDPAELERARLELSVHASGVQVLACDLRDADQVRAAVAEAVKVSGPIEVLINNAGIIQVGPLEEMTLEDFAEAMDVHFWGPLHLIWAVLPEMRRRRRGRIVNITSIGGRVAVPHLAPYTASKFALVGLSAALRVELFRAGVLVTTVVPGLMRTGSHLNASFKGRHHDEYTWFSIGGALPLFSMDSRRAARQIVEACRHGDAHLTLSMQARTLEAAAGLMPETMASLMQLGNRLLPGPDGIGSQARTGRDSASRWSPSLITRLSDRAADRNNEK